MTDQSSLNGAIGTIEETLYYIILGVRGAGLWLSRDHDFWEAFGSSFGKGLLYGTQDILALVVFFFGGSD